MTSRTLASTRRPGAVSREDLAGRRDLFLMMATGLMMASGIGWGAEATRQLPPAVLVVAVGIVAVGGLFTDVFIGLAIGLVAAALVAASQLLAHRSATDAPWAYVATLVLLVLLGGVTGTASERLRRERRRQLRAEAMAVIPAGGSLGLLGLDDAQLRLVEELARAHRYSRPFSIITLRAHVDPRALSPDDVRRARRAVARVLESGLHSTDTPYVIDEETFGVLLPETTADNARLVADSLAAEAGNATFADRTAGERRAVRDVTELGVGVREVMGAEVEAREQQAEALLIASRETLQAVPADNAAAGRLERA